MGRTYSVPGAALEDETIPRYRLYARSAKRVENRYLKIRECLKFILIDREMPK